MTTKLDKTLKREITLNNQAYVLTLTPDGLKLTLKGKRKGHELQWLDLVSGEAALAVALNASLQRAGAHPVSEQRAESPPPRVRKAKKKNAARSGRGSKG